MDIITFGEALIDLPSTVNGVSLAEAPAFAKVPAGAPANVAVAAARLGLQSAFITHVGCDPFGEAILQTFAARGVDVSRCRRDPAARTGLAFVSIREDGERDFLFYFDPARDLPIQAEALDREFIQSTRVFHYGSISMIADPCRTATLAAARIAGEQGALVSYDPNLRFLLWPNSGIMRETALQGFAFADTAKVSTEELTFLYPDPEQESAARRLLSDYPNLSLLCVTDGPNGSSAYLPGHAHAFHAPAFPIQAVDATGAGDAWVAGLLVFLLRQNWEKKESADTLAQMISQALPYANACGAIAATERGAAMEGLNEAAVQRLLQSVA